MPELALLGGTPVVRVPAPHFSWPPITPATERAVLQQLHTSISIYDKSGIVDRLESRVADRLGRTRALLTSSGTAALHSMFVAAGIGEGDEVICPAYTFFATVTPLFFTGAVPVLADCGADGNLDSDEVARRLTPRTRAVVVTHMWGFPCRMEPLLEVAGRAGVPVFEDASHAHGATWRGRPAGGFGRAAALSLQGQKTLTGGEGGVLVTDDDELYYRALLLGHYNRRCRDEIPSTHPLARYAVSGMGLKLRVHPLAAAIADQQLDELDGVLRARARTAERLGDMLAGLPGIDVLPVPPEARPSWYAFLIRYTPEALGGLPIERFHAALVAEGCRELDRPASTCPLNLLPLFQDPGSLFPRYQGRISYRPGDFPRAEAFHASVLKLPVWTEPGALLEQYAAAFHKVVSHHQELL